MKKDEIKIIEYQSVYGTHYKILILKNIIFGRIKKWVFEKDFDGRIETYFTLKDVKKSAKFMIEGTKETEIPL